MKTSKINAFTLTEALVVVVVVVIFVLMAIPTGPHVQVKGRQTAALSNVKQIVLACKLFAMDNVGLTFTKDALKALAQEAARKGTGARALRAILEKIMLDLMYDLPSREDILEVTINRAVIDGKKSPLIRRKQDKEAA